MDTEVLGRHQKGSECGRAPAEFRCEFDHVVRQGLWAAAATRQVRHHSLRVVGAYTCATKEESVCLLPWSRSVLWQCFVGVYPGVGGGRLHGPGVQLLRAWLVLRGGPRSGRRGRMLLWPDPSDRLCDPPPASQGIAGARDGAGGAN